MNREALPACQISAAALPAHVRAGLAKAGGAKGAAVLEVTYVCSGCDAGGGGAEAGGGRRTARVDLGSEAVTNLVCPSTYPRECDTIT